VIIRLVLGCFAVSIETDNRSYTCTGWLTYLQWSQRRAYLNISHWKPPKVAQFTALRTLL